MEGGVRISLPRGMVWASPHRPCRPSTAARLCPGGAAGGRAGTCPHRGGAAPVPRCRVFCAEDAPSPSPSPSPSVSLASSVGAPPRRTAAPCWELGRLPAGQSQKTSCARRSSQASRAGCVRRASPRFARLWHVGRRSPALQEIVRTAAPCRICPIQPRDERGV